MLRRLSDISPCSAATWARELVVSILTWWIHVTSLRNYTDFPCDDVFDSIYDKRGEYYHVRGFSQHYISGLSRRMYFMKLD